MQLPSSNSIWTLVPKWAMVLSALLVLVARLAVITGTELFPDEALYVWLSQAELFGFSPHPPGVNLLVRGGSALLGRSEEGVRILFLLLGTLIPVPIYLLARKLAGSAVAIWSAFAALGVPIFGAFGAIATPDAPQLFLWAVALLTTAHALENGKLRWWVTTGALVGIALLVKYIAVLFFPSLLLCLILGPRWRSHLASPGPYLAVAVAVLVFAPPFLLSQSASDWSAVRYHLADRQSFTPPSAKAFLVYQGLHLAYVSPLLYGLAIGAVAWAGLRGIRRHEEWLLFLFSFSAVMWLFFGVIAVVTERELSREQWDAPAYVTAVIATGILLQEKVLGRPGAGRKWRGLAIAAPLLGLAMFCLMNGEGLTGWLTGKLGRTPLYANFRGWSATAGAADRALAQLPPGPAPSFFLGNSFAEAHQFAFYTARPGTSVYTLDNSANERFGLEAVLKAEGIDQAGMDRLPPGTNAVFAMVETVEPGANSSAEKRRRKLEKFFGRVELLPEVLTSLGGRPIRRGILFACYGLK